MLSAGWASSLKNSQIRFSMLMPYCSGASKGNHFCSVKLLMCGVTRNRPDITTYRHTGSGQGNAAVPDSLEVAFDAAFVCLEK